MTEERAPRWLRAAALAAACFLAFAGAWNHELWTYDEPREAELARALYRSGPLPWTVLNEQPFLEKPPLFTWSVAASFVVAGGPSILGARLVAALWSLGTLAVVAWFARRTISERAGLVAALVLATTNRFFTCQHTILLDNALCALTTAAIAFGWIAATEKRRGLAVAAGAALAGAFLTKGAIGPGIIVLVLGVALGLARESPRPLLHPLVLLVAALPPLLHVWLLDRMGGRELVRELYWNNQLGRFFHGYQSKDTSWHLYLRTWWEMVAPWTPVAALAIARPPARPVTRLLLVWAVAPLALLSISAARSRFYAVPAVPPHALLVALLWETVELPAWGRRVLDGIWLAGAVAVAALAAWIETTPVRDGLALLAFLIAPATLLAKKGDKETRAIGFCLVVLAGWLLWVSDFEARRREPKLSYKELSDQVWARAAGRRLVLFHVSDSYSGTFPFYADRSTPGFDEVVDPDGQRLVAAVTTRDVVLLPADALGKISEEKRAELEIERPPLVHAADQDTVFLLLKKRASAP